jgi:ABC-2 type transport system permease protein
VISTERKIEQVSAMINFLVQAYSTYRGLFGWFNWFGYISSVILHPVVLVIMYSILGRFTGSPELIRDCAMGVAAYTMVYIVMFGILQCYTYDRFGGTLSAFFASPANRLVSYIARAVLHYPNALICFTTTLITAWIMLDLDFGSVNWAGFVVAVLVTAASITALGAFFATFAIVFRDWTITGVLPVSMILVFSGVIIPLTVFPVGIQEFAKLLPVTNGLVAIRDTFAGGQVFQTSGYIIREMLTGLAYFVIGFAGFTLFERVSKQTGTLELETF